MIVYIFYNDFYKKVFLPTKVIGVYPIYLSENRVLFNIESKDNEWYVKAADGFQILVNGEEQIHPKLSQNDTYIITNMTFYVYMVATPEYVDNKNFLRVDGNEFTFGSGNKNDIVYKNGYIKDSEFKVSLNQNGYWEILSDTKNVYLNDKLVSRSYLFSGDYIFCYGVKILFFMGILLINGPEGLKISDKKFRPADIVVPEHISSNNFEIMDDLPLYTKRDYFTKSPRFIADEEQYSIKIDPLVLPEKQEEAPLLLTLGPQLTMLSMSLFSFAQVIVDFIEGNTDTMKLFASVLTFAVMLAGVLIWPFVSKMYQAKHEKDKEKKAKTKYRKQLEKKTQEIEELKQKYYTVLYNRFPFLKDCVSIIEGRKSELWEKNIDDEDFLEVCLGIGTAESNITVITPDESLTPEEDRKSNSIKDIVESAKYINNVPFPFSFAKNYLCAAVGETNYCLRLVDNIFLQLMAFHSYADLKIIIFTKEEEESRWEYLKILPHCWDNQHNVRYFATNIEDFNEFAVDLDSIFDNRKNESDNEKLEDDGRDDSNVEPYILHKPYYFIFTDNIDQIRNTSLIKKILYYKKNLGFGLFVVNETLSNLPDQTHTFINVKADTSRVFTNTIKADQSLNTFQVDYSTPYDIYRCAQFLANTPILLEKGKYELPKSLTFLGLYKVGRVEQLNSLDRWKNNNPTTSLSVPIGIDQNGEIFKLDLHEKVYGPHGLVAGTTGSGKSEWIVTLILSLAVNFNPDEVQFVLIDYKGGGLAMSFENKELGIKLPHLAGTITNLDKSAINRSIASIESELKRRQSIFNDAREKLKEGSMDIYKYQQFYRKGLVDTPLSHLFIICDEFAELKQQQPEFMDQLISTSRIGRSLGVHLILATQKPTGVVNDQIWSNSRFKVCLRVQDVSDSNEILKKPDAAYLKQAGAFYLEVGSDEYYNLGQAAWAGAKYYPSDVVTKEVDQSVQSIDNIGKILNFFDTTEQRTKKMEASQGEELLNVVQYIDTISRDEKYVKQQLWLPNVSENTTLEELKKRYKFTPQKMNFTTAIGEYDEPRRQEQGLLSVDLAKGNIAIVGQPGSGKEQLLSTIIFSSLTEHTPKEINYYILDFGAETLRKFAKFPHVGEVVFQDDMERVGGVIQLIMEEVNRRKILFQDYNGSLKFYNEHSGKILPLICLVINGYDVFQEVLSRVVDSLNSLFRDAPRYGIVFVLSASSQNTFRQRILQYFDRFILLNLQDESQYRQLTNCRRGLIPGNAYGRGICKLNDDADSYCEFQTAKIIDADKEIAYLKQVSDVLNSGYKERAKKITTIPDNISSSDLTKFITTLSDVPIGYNFYEKDIAKLDLLSTKVYPIITKDLKNNIFFIYALANLLSKIPNTVVRVIDLLKIFDKPILDIKYFKDGLGAVFDALGNDVTNRKETQPFAINIILGAASIRQTLDKESCEKAMVLFDKMNNAKQNVYILIDNYKQFKLLKLEPWFSKVDASNGIWLGEGIDTQSILISNNLLEEDKKYNFPGMAYYVKNGSYTLIKTMMDGDD